MVASGVEMMNGTPMMNFIHQLREAMTLVGILTLVFMWSLSDSQSRRWSKKRVANLVSWTSSNGIWRSLTIFAEAPDVACGHQTGPIASSAGEDETPVGTAGTWRSSSIFSFSCSNRAGKAAQRNSRTQRIQFRTSSGKEKLKRCQFAPSLTPSVQSTRRTTAHVQTSEHYLLEIFKLRCMVSMGNTHRDQQLKKNLSLQHHLPCLHEKHPLITPDPIPPHSSTILPDFVEGEKSSLISHPPPHSGRPHSPPPCLFLPKPTDKGEKLYFLKKLNPRMLYRVKYIGPE
ncbi:uncharacterized protein LOC141990070 [Natator depressus]|uniref:uncharacterized protein LOC141990070 n=1 Tax=Natator depressus TaxID=27790 RepID=UPI003EB79AD0